MTNGKSQSPCWLASTVMMLDRLWCVPTSMHECLKTGAANAWPRAGRTGTKIHAVVDALGNPQRWLSGGEVADIDQAQPLLPRRPDKYKNCKPVLITLANDLSVQCSRCEYFYGSIQEALIASLFLLSPRSLDSSWCGRPRCGRLSRRWFLSHRRS